MHGVVDEEHFLFRSDPANTVLDHPLGEHRIQRLEIIQHGNRKVAHLSLAVSFRDLFIAHNLPMFSATAVPARKRCNYLVTHVTNARGTARKSTIREKNHGQGGTDPGHRNKFAPVSADVGERECC